MRGGRRYHRGPDFGHRLPGQPRLRKLGQAGQQELAEQAAANTARRDYEYEARKRLYAECEPLLFQIGEFSKGGIRHIQGLARSARNRDIRPDGSGWLTTDDLSKDVDEHYYLYSTLYRVIAPLTCVALLHRRLTTVDLAVDTDLRQQFRLTRWLNSVITDEFDLALLDPECSYKPNDPDAATRQRHDLATYKRQGLYTGRRDTAAEALIVREKDQPPRCMSFGEFEQALREQPHVVQAFEPVRQLFHGFHPRTHPVLWRVLIAQAHIYDELVRSQARKLVVSTGGFAAASPPPLERERFDWRAKPDEAPDDDVLVAPFDVAAAYIKRLQSR